MPLPEFRKLAGLDPGIARHFGPVKQSAAIGDLLGRGLKAIGSAGGQAINAVPHYAGQAGLAAGNGLRAAASSEAGRTALAGGTGYLAGEGLGEVSGNPYGTAGGIGLGSAAALLASPKLRRGLSWYGGELAGNRANGSVAMPVTNAKNWASRQLGRAPAAGPPQAGLADRAFSVATTPWYAPFTRYQYPAATAASGLAATSVVGGSLAAGLAKGPEALRNEFASGVGTAAGDAGLEPEARGRLANNVYDKFYSDILPSVATEDSNIAQAHRSAIGSLAMPFIRENLHRVIQTGPPVSSSETFNRYFGRAVDALRSATPSGAAMTALIHGAAKPMPAGTVANTFRENVGPNPLGYLAELPKSHLLQTYAQSAAGPAVDQGLTAAGPLAQEVRPQVADALARQGAPAGRRGGPQ